MSPQVQTEPIQPQPQIKPRRFNGLAPGQPRGGYSSGRGCGKVMRRFGQKQKGPPQQCRRTMAATVRLLPGIVRISLWFVPPPRG
jgi:hypothetical protein